MFSHRPFPTCTDQSGSQVQRKIASDTTLLITGTVPGIGTGVITPLLIDVAKVAHRLGIGQSTVYRWDAVGRLGPQSIKLGGRRLWRVDEVERWVEARCPNRQKWPDMEKRRRQAKGAMFE